MLVGEYPFAPEEVCKAFFLGGIALAQTYGLLRYLLLLRHSAVVDWRLSSADSASEGADID